MHAACKQKLSDSLQVYHWNTTRKIEQYYYDLAKLEKAKSSE